MSRMFWSSVSQCGKALSSRIAAVQGSLLPATTSLAICRASVCRATSNGIGYSTPRAGNIRPNSASTSSRLFTLTSAATRYIEGSSRPASMSSIATWGTSSGSRSPHNQREASNMGSRFDNGGGVPDTKCSRFVLVIHFATSFEPIAQLHQSTPRVSSESPKLRYALKTGSGT